MKSKIVTSLLAVLAIASVSSCKKKEASAVEQAIAAAEKMDRNELYKKAIEELDGKTMNCVGNSSRGATALEHFIAYLQGKSAKQVVTDKVDDKGKPIKIWQYTEDEEIRKAFPDYKADFSGKITWQQPKNNSIFDMIDGDISAGSGTFSLTLIQDGSQIQSKELDTGNLLNYIPKEWEGEASNKEPLALQSLNKVFMFNNQGGEAQKTYMNMWDFVRDDEKPQFMGINSEPVGRNFLVQITEPKYAAQVKAAYDALPAAQKTMYDADIASVETVASQYGVEGENAKYALAWVKRWLKQYNQQTDDAPICTNLVTKSNTGESGLLVYSKLRSITETDTQSKNNVTVAAYQDGYVGLGGYMYKHYMQILKTCPFPYAACAFIHFMTETKEGFSAWGKDIGGYAGDTKTRAMFNHSNDGGTETPNINDKGYTYWEPKCVVEDPAYVASKATLTTWFDTLRK